MLFHYSKSEMTDKKYTVNQAVDAAKAVVKAKKPNIGICMTAVRNRDLKELITLKELNEISDKISFDSFYYA